MGTLKTQDEYSVRSYKHWIDIAFGSYNTHSFSSEKWDASGVCHRPEIDTTSALQARNVMPMPHRPRMDMASSSETWDRYDSCRDLG